MARPGPGRLRRLYQLKWPLLHRAGERYLKQGSPPLGGETFAAFKRRNAGWLDPYAFFRALKDRHGGRAWMNWPAGLRTFAAARRSPLRPELEPECEFHRFCQYVFFTQWQRVRAAAALRGVRIIGDIPIFAAADSADVWTHPELFEIDERTGRPDAVAGVPPTIFRPTANFGAILSIGGTATRPTASLVAGAPALGFRALRHRADRPFPRF